MSEAARKVYDIHDIRSGVTMDLREEAVIGLSKPPGQRTIPTVVLYDEEGLLLYDAITTEAKEYYLFGAEEDILRHKADDVVRAMHGGHGDQACDVLELGAGALRKTSHLLKALASESHSQVTYYALDLEPRELDRTLGELTNPEFELARQLEGRVRVQGLCGTYEDGIKMVREGGLDAVQRESVAWESADRQGRPVAGDAPPALRRRGSSPSPMSSNSADSSSSRDCSSQSYRSGYSTPPTPGSSGASLDQAQSPTDKRRPLHIAFLGSSIGNFPRDAAGDFLQSLPLRPGSGDTLLLGLDGRNDPAMVELAYHDPAGHTERFIMNGLKAAGRLLGTDSLVDARKWAYESRFNNELGRHEAYYKCLEGHMIRLDEEQTAQFVEGELVHIENAYKYSDKDAYELFNAAQLVPVRRWKDSEDRYSLWLLERPAVFFPLVRQVMPSPGIARKALTLADASSGPFAVPTLDEWSALWNAWDAVTLGMISPQMMHERPIDLRHICLFYLGHIPAFLDIHLSRLLNEPHTEPEYFKDIFERGIDPHVDDPTQCHPHSEVPTNLSDWPSLDEILAFRDRVRARVKALYDDLESGAKPLTRKTARVLAMTLEHEGFHTETLLYMLLQRAGPPAPGTLPPPNTRTPDWDGLREEWDTLPQATATVEFGPEDVVLGHDDPEKDDDDTALLEDPSWEYGWDNEHPRRTVKLEKAVRVSSRCITNGEYEAYWLAERAAGRSVETPKSWAMSNTEEVQVRTLYGPVPLRVAHDWPVLASYDALNQYAAAKGGRLPTEAELRLFMDRYFESTGANFGFKNWHLTPATTGTPGTDGHGHNGGAFEWTSTVMMDYPGYESSRLYPGYSSDFFDSKHQVVLGGSYATIPRIAQRRTVRNFYQHNYPYAWVAGRVAFDA